MNTPTEIDTLLAAIAAAQDATSAVEDLERQSVKRTADRPALVAAAAADPAWEPGTGAGTGVIDEDLAILERRAEAARSAEVVRWLAVHHAFHTANAVIGDAVQEIAWQARCAGHRLQNAIARRFVDDPPRNSINVSGAGTFVATAGAYLVEQLDQFRAKALQHDAINGESLPALRSRGQDLKETTLALVAEIPVAEDGINRAHRAIAAIRDILND